MNCYVTIPGMNHPLAILFLAARHVDVSEMLHDLLGGKFDSVLREPQAELSHLFPGQR